MERDSQVTTWSPSVVMMFRAGPLYPLVFAIVLVLSGCLGPLDPAAEVPDPLDAAVMPAPHGDTPLAQVHAALVDADARMFGPGASLEVPRSHDLGASVRAFLADHDHQPTPEETRRLAALATLPTATAQALGDLIEAFRSLEATTAVAFEDADRPRLEDAARAQHGFVAAAVALERALAEHGTAAPAAVPTAHEDAFATELRLAAGAAPITFGTLLSIDLVGASDTYHAGINLLIDVGGNDDYRNNAGGNGLSYDHCHQASLTSPTSVPHPTVAALVDLGGDDLYETERDCGKAGGAAWGAGALIDAAGADRYTNGGMGTNGGGTAHGLGLLLDAAGDDVYSATGGGTNGGGFAGGIGRLIDRSGDDRYSATTDGANGGARGGIHCFVGCTDVRPAQGLLLDLSGTDLYLDYIVKDEADRSVVPKEFYGAQIDIEQPVDPPQTS